ncbi:Hypothetical_protein [Hexamita inflata]|uniref:Hypothetical_protein n=1 Tax=Hexamita inflata TaxID=28002 RepID=A0AA86U860_9EUKA|nr:Hypothetical protein HINF_LOCUS30376 [Hexamita inflata]
MSDVNMYLYNLKTDLSQNFKKLEKRMDKLQKKLEVKSEFRTNLNSTKLIKNKHVPSELLDDEGNVKSMSKAFDFVFPEFYEKEPKQKRIQFEEYEFNFTEIPEYL